jgi:glycosyltransferase involved in cell wall biosynthesis
MNLLYVSLSYIPSRRASSVHVMRMCAALGRAGHRVELIGKQSHEESTDDDHAFYGVDRAFSVTKLPRPAWRGGGVVFAAGMAKVLLDRKRDIDLVYSREPVGALVAAELGLDVVFESHGIPVERSQQLLLRRLMSHRRLRGLVVISDALRRDLEAQQLGPRSSTIVIAHDAADPPGSQVSFHRVRRERPRIGYVGNLYEGRGIDLIVDLAERMPDCDVELVGGNEQDLAKWRARVRSRNITFAGFVQPGQLRERYQSFDALLMPHPRTGVAAATGIDISRWTSPMKMFEYMASGVPIVASDLPVLREVLEHERNALIAPAGDLDAWEQAIRRLCDERSLAESLARHAYDDLISTYTWDARVARIFRGLGLS